MGSVRAVRAGDEWAAGTGGVGIGSEAVGDDSRGCSS